MLMLVVIYDKHVSSGNYLASIWIPDTHIGVLITHTVCPLFKVLRILGEKTENIVAPVEQILYMGSMYPVQNLYIWRLAWHISHGYRCSSKSRHQ